MDENERYAKGMAVRRKVLGNAWVDRAEAGKTAFNAEFQAMINRSPWGEIWTRPHFDERTRRILVIGTMMALGCWDEFAPARAGRADRGRFHAGRHQGDHPPADRLLRGAGRQSRLQGGRRDRCVMAGTG